MRTGIGSKTKEVCIPELEEIPNSPLGAWTSEDIAILKKYYPTKPTSAIAKYLEKSYSSVANKAYQLGLRKVRAEAEIE